MPQRFAYVLVCLLAYQTAHADWLPSLPSIPSPDAWLKQQCLSRISQYPELKLKPNERHATCNCMTRHAKQTLTARDILKMAQLSDAELDKQYRSKAKVAFEQCQTNMKK